MKSDPAKENSNQAVEAEKSLTHRTLSGLLWMFSGSTVHVVLRILVLVILARFLTPEDYGLVGAAQVIVSFAQLFSQLGIGPALVQRSHLEERHLRTALTVFTLTGVLVGGLIALSAPLIARFFQMDELTPILRVAALAFPLQGLTAVPSALLKRELEFRWLAGISILAYFGGFGVIGISLALLGFGAWALVGAMLARLVINVIVLQLVQPFLRLPRIERRALRELMYFGGGFTLARLLNYTAGQGDNLVVGRWLGTEALGLYGRAYQMLVFPVNLFGDVIDQVLFPSMAKVQDDPKRLGLAYRRGISLTALIYLPISVLVIVLAPEIVLVILGPTWVEAVIPFQILAAGMLFRANKIDHTVARATGAVYRRAWRQGVYALAIFVGAWIGQNWGIPGVAIGVLIALAVNFVLMVHLSLALTSATWRRLLAALLPGLLLAAAAFVQIWVTATVLRNLDMPPIVVLLGSSASTGIGLLALLYLRPQFLLGQDGTWILQTLTRYVVKKLKLSTRAKQVVEKRRILVKENVKDSEN